jgi:choline kinase
VIIVVGFRFEKVENLLRGYDGWGMRIKTLYNPFHRKTNSLISLWIASAEMNEDVVIINGDDVFEIEVLERTLVVRYDEKICLPVKRKPGYEEEDMKVVTKGDRIIEIGRVLTTSSSAESVGIRVFRDIGVELLKRAIEEEVRIEGAEKKWYASAIQRLLEKGCRVKSLDIGHLFWMDVDYPSDLFRARFNSNKFIRKSQGERILRVVEANP